MCTIVVCEMLLNHGATHAANQKAGLFGALNCNNLPTTTSFMCVGERNGKIRAASGGGAKTSRCFIEARFVYGARGMTLCSKMYPGKEHGAPSIAQGKWSRLEIEVEAKFTEIAACYTYLS